MPPKTSKQNGGTCFVTKLVRTAQVPKAAGKEKRWRDACGAATL